MLTMMNSQLLLLEPWYAPHQTHQWEVDVEVGPGVDSRAMTMMNSGLLKEIKSHSLMMQMTK